MTVYTKTVNERMDIVARTETTFQTSSMSPVTTNIYTFTPGSGNKEIILAEIHVLGGSAQSSGQDVASYVFHCTGEYDDGGGVTYVYDLNETLHLTNGLGADWTATIVGEAGTHLRITTEQTVSSAPSVDWQVWAKFTRKVASVS